MKAVVFDMDGVIVDSEAQWKALEAEFFRAAVPTWREEHHAEIVGMGVSDVYRHLVRAHGLAMTEAEFLERSDRVARDVYEKKVVVAEGFLDFLTDLRRRRVPTAIASSSPTRWIAMVLDRFALRPRFDAVVSADDVGGRTKPQPDIYLEAAARLELPPEECLAIEDSSIGLLAAKRAGLKCVALRTDHNGDQNLSAADLALDGFAGLDYEGLIARLKAA